MPRNGNIIVVENVLSSEGSSVLGKAAEVEEDLASAIKENLKLKSHQQPCHVCGQQRHPRYSPYLVPRRSESSGVLSAVAKDCARRTCAASHQHQQESDKDPYELLQELLQQGTLIQEAVRRLQDNVDLLYSVKMSSEVESNQLPSKADTLDTENSCTPKTEPVPEQGALHEMSNYPFSKHDRESLSSVSSDSGDVSNGHCCDIEEDGIVVIPEYNTPIIGYEVMEERARFTVFKIRVEHVESGRYWFVFRRYTDFARLSKQLKPRFPGLQLCLPPKRWFGNNFDPMFLEDRVLGLQAFVKNIMGHRDISKSAPVREFFCLDDPPEPLDTIEESRALCENLEEEVYRLNQQLQEREAEIELLRSEVDSLQHQNSLLLKALKEMQHGEINILATLKVGVEAQKLEDRQECSFASWASAALLRDRRQQLLSSHAFGLHTLNLTLSSMADGSKEVVGEQDPTSVPAASEAGDSSGAPQSRRTEADIPHPQESL